MVCKTGRLSGRRHCGPVAQDLASRRRDGPLDLWRRQAPAASGRLRRSFDQAARHVIAIAALALHRVTGRQALAAFVEEPARERTGN